jgi:hypothetical protein
VGVHFLGQPAGQFDRLDLGAESAAEDTLYEAFDPTLEVAKNADRDLLSRKRYGSPGGGTGLKS